MGSNEVSALISLKGEQEFRRALTAATGALREVESSSKLVDEQFRGQRNTMEALRAQHEVLNNALAARKRKEEELGKALENAKRNQENVGKGLEKLLGKWDEENEKLEELKKTYGESSEEVKEQEEKVKELSDAMERGNRNYETAGNRIQRWQTQLNSAQAETLRANRALEENERYLGEAEQATDHCATSIDRFGNRVRESGENLEDSGQAVSDWADKFKSAVVNKGVSMMADAIGNTVDKMKEVAAYAIDVGKSFEAAMAEVAAVSGATGNDLNALTEKAKEMGASTKFSATESAEAMNYMAMAGWKTEDMLNGIGGIMSLAAASGEDLAATSDIVTDALTAFGLSASDSGHFSDVLAAASSNANTNVSMLGETFKYCAPIAGTFGFSVEDTAEAIGLMGNSSIKASQAGTAMRALLTSLAGEVTFTGKAIGEVTIRTKETDGSMRNLGEILTDCREAFGQMTDSEKSANAEALVGKNAMSGFLAVMNAAPKDIEKLNGALTNCDGAAAQMAETMQDNLQGKVTILQSTLEGLGISAYEKFSGPLQDAAEEATGIIEELTEKMNNGDLGRAFEILAESLGDNVDVLDDVADGLIWIIEHGDLIIATLKGIATGMLMYKAVSGITSVISALQAMRTALVAAESAQAALNLAQLANPVALVTAGVAALGVALVSLANSGMKRTKTEAGKAADEAENLADRMADLKERVEEQADAQREEAMATTAQYKNYEAMSNKIYELNDAIKSGAMTEAEATTAKAQMSYYVQKLNSEMPGLSLEIDKQTGLIKQGKEATDQYITSMKNKAIASVIEGQLTELYEQQAKAQIEGIAAEGRKADYHDKAADAAKKAALYQEAYNERVELGNRDAYDAVNGQGAYAKALEDIAKKHKISNAELEKASDIAEAAAKDAEDYGKAEQAAAREVKEAKGAEKAATAAINEKSEATAKYMKQQGYTNEEIAAMTGILLENTGEMENNAEATDNAAGSAQNYAESAEDIAASSEAQKEALESLREKFEEIKSSIEQSMEVNMFEKFDGGDTYNIDKLIENLKGQRKALADWEANMQTLAGEIGRNMNVELFDKLLEMGPDQGANFAQQLVNTLNNEGGSKMKELAEQWAGALSDRETYANSLARTQSIIKTIMGEMSNSTELDFSNLRESLEGAASAAAEGGEVISEELKKSFLDTVKAAEEMGAEIPEGLADKIASGDVSIGDAIAQLKGSMEAQFNFLSELAGEAGIEIDDEIRKGILNGGEDAVKAIAQLQEKILKKQEESEKEFKKGGKKNTEAVGAGTEEAKPEVVSKTGSVMQQSADTANSYYMQFRNVGSNMMSGVALGMTSNSNLVYDAVRRILEQAKKEADKATDSRSPSRVWRNQVGAYMSQGLALGISDGTKDVTSAATGLARSATKATKEELDINSPSKIFIKLGGYISEGLGIGIKNKKGYAVQTSKKMAKEVYKASAEWMEKYMSSHNVSLEGEKKFWKQLAKTVKKDSKSYKDALKHAAANDKFIKEVRGKVKDAFDVSWYTKKAKKTVKKDADKYYGEVTKAAKKFIDNKKAVDGTGLRQEKYFWEQVKKKAGKGTQTYADAAKRIKEINKDIKKQVKANAETKQEKKEYGVSGAGLELYKSLYKVSAQAEIDYWKKIRKNGKLTKAQKLEVDKNILEAEENFNEQMKALKDDYYEKCKDINDKLKDDIEELTEEYETAFADRKTAIKSAFGTFDEFSSEAEAPEVLLENMKSQAAGYALWIEQLGELEGKGILKSPFIEKLRQMGPEAAATIMSLNMMSEEQLRQAQQAWDEKDRLAEAQAAKETEALRKKNEEQIKKLREEAQKQLDTYKAEYEAASAELSAAMSGPLEELAVKATTLGEKATAELILGMKDRAESKATKKELKEVRKEVASGLNGLPKKGKDIGGDMLAGLLSGLSNKLEITKGAKSFVEELEAAIKAAAGIHSPSRRFRDAVGKQIPAGVAQGVEEGTAEAERAGAGMVDSMLAKSAERMERQRAALKGYAEGLNGSAGIAALDNLTAPHLAQSTNITVNNTGVAEMLGGVTAEIQKLGGEIRRMKIMLDTGELVGAIGDELAMEARRA